MRDPEGEQVALREQKRDSLPTAAMPILFRAGSRRATPL